MTWGAKDTSTEMDSTEGEDIRSQLVRRSKEGKKSHHRNGSSRVQKLEMREHQHHCRKDKDKGKTNDGALGSTKKARSNRRKQGEDKGLQFLTRWVMGDDNRDSRKFW